MCAVRAGDWWAFAQHRRWRCVRWNNKNDMCSDDDVFFCREQSCAYVFVWHTQSAKRASATKKYAQIMYARYLQYALVYAQRVRVQLFRTRIKHAWDAGHWCRRNWEYYSALSYIYYQHTAFVYECTIHIVYVHVFLILHTYHSPYTL